MLAALGSVPPGGCGDGRLAAAIDRVLDRALDRPRLRSDVEIARFTTRWGDRYAIAHSPTSGAYLRFNGDQGDVIGDFDGTRSVGDLTRTGGAALGVDRVIELVGLLRRRGFLEQPPLDVYAAVDHRLKSRRQKVAAGGWRVLRKPTVALPGVDAFTRRVYRAGGRLVFAPAAIVATAPVAGLGLIAFVVVAGRGDYPLIGHLSTTTAVSLLALVLVAAFVHEMGHALAIVHAGRRVVTAGFQLYLGHPAFFIDSTDLLLAPARARAVNALAGVYADMVVAGVVAIGAWTVVGGGTGELLFRFAGLIYLGAALNLIPFLELDGYWALCDLADVPRLRPRSFAVLRDQLPDRLRGRRARFTRSERAMALFGIASVVFTIAAIVAAWIFWGPVARQLVIALWGSGAGGRVVLGVLLVLIVGPVLYGCADQAAVMAARVRRLLADLRFWAQTSWRIQAAHAVAALATEGLDEAVLGELAGRVGRRHIRTGQVLVSQGRAADAYYVVRSGRFAVVQGSIGGAERLVGYLGPGDSCGDDALVEGRAQLATVRAETGGEVFVVDAGTFGRLIVPAMTSLPRREPSLFEVWALPPFRHLAQADAAIVAAGGESVRLGPGHTVLRQCDLADRFYVVVSGQAEVVRDGQRLVILRAGDHFGPADTSALFPVTVRTLTPVRLFSIDAEVAAPHLAHSMGRAGYDDARRVQW